MVPQDWNPKVADPDVSSINNLVIFYLIYFKIAKKDVSKSGAQNMLKISIFRLEQEF